MPKMNGYEFFKAVSDKPVLNHIPFLFLSALDILDDICLRKMLVPMIILLNLLNQRI